MPGRHRRTKRKFRKQTKRKQSRRRQRGGALPFLTLNRGPTIAVGLPGAEDGKIGDVDTVPLVRTV